VLALPRSSPIHLIRGRHLAPVPVSTGSSSRCRLQPAQHLRLEHFFAVAATYASPAETAGITLASASSSGWQVAGPVATFSAELILLIYHVGGMFIEGRIVRKWLGVKGSASSGLEELGASGLEFAMRSASVDVFGLELNIQRLGNFQNCPFVISYAVWNTDNFERVLSRVLLCIAAANFQP